MEDYPQDCAGVLQYALRTTIGLELNKVRKQFEKECAATVVLKTDPNWLFPSQIRFCFSLCKSYLSCGGVMYCCSNMEWVGEDMKTPLHHGNVWQLTARRDLTRGPNSEPLLCIEDSNSTYCINEEPGHLSSPEHEYDLWVLHNIDAKEPTYEDWTLMGIVIATRWEDEEEEKDVIHGSSVTSGGSGHERQMEDRSSPRINKSPTTNTTIAPGVKSNLQGQEPKKQQESSETEQHQKVEKLGNDNSSIDEAEDVVTCMGGVDTKALQEAGESKLHRTSLVQETSPKHFLGVVASMQGNTGVLDQQNIPAPSSESSTQASEILAAKTTLIRCSNSDELAADGSFNVEGRELNTSIQSHPEKNVEETSKEGGELSRISVQKSEMTQPSEHETIAINKKSSEHEEPAASGSIDVLAGGPSTSTQQYFEKNGQETSTKSGRLPRDDLHESEMLQPNSPEATTESNGISYTGKQQEVPGAANLHGTQTDSLAPKHITISGVVEQGQHAGEDITSTPELAAQNSTLVTSTSDVGSLQTGELGTTVESQKTETASTDQNLSEIPDPEHSAVMTSTSVEVEKALVSENSAMVSPASSTNVEKTPAKQHTWSVSPSNSPASPASRSSAIGQVHTASFKQALAKDTRKSGLSPKDASKLFRSMTSPRGKSRASVQASFKPSQQSKAEKTMLDSAEATADLKTSVAVEGRHGDVKSKFGDGEKK